MLRSKYKYLSHREGDGERVRESGGGGSWRNLFANSIE